MKHIFLAELRKVEAKKLVTNDVEVIVTLNTNDTKVLELGKISPDTILRVYVQDARDPVLHIPATVKSLPEFVKSEPEPIWNEPERGEDSGVE